MDAAHRVKELHRDANPITAAANAPLQDVVHAKLAADLAYVDRLSLVLQGGVVGDDEEFGEPGQLRSDILGDAVRKIVLVLVAAGVVQGQHGDRRPVGQGGDRLLGRPPACATKIAASPGFVSVAGAASM